MGRITDSGELIAPFNTLESFCSLHKGKSLIIRAEILPTEASERLRNFVFGYVVPELQTAYHLMGEDYTKAQTWQAIRSVCPIFLEEERENGKWRVRVKDWEEIDNTLAVEFITWVQRYAAENLNLIIDDPE